METNQYADTITIPALKALLEGTAPPNSYLQTEATLTEAKYIYIDSNLTTCPQPPKWVQQDSGWLHLWANSYHMGPLPEVGQRIIVKGGIDSFGARYPAFVISAIDVTILLKVLIHRKILTPGENEELDEKKLLKKAHRCSKLIQLFLLTDSFNDVCGQKVWNNFDTFSDVFRNQCLRFASFSAMKTTTQGKVIMTSVALLPVLFGDCREHNILLHIMLKIVLEHHKSTTCFVLSSVYTVGGKATQKEFECDLEHTFPILWGIQSQKVFFVDALFHTTSNLPYPEIENQGQVQQHTLSDNMRAKLALLPAHLMLATDFAFTGGSFFAANCQKTTGANYMVVPTAFSGKLCYRENKTDKTTSMHVYGSRIQADIDLTVDMINDLEFQDKRKKALAYASVCRVPLATNRSSQSPLQ